jgi:hypothetical protein
MVTARTRFSSRSFYYAGRTTFGSYPVAGIVSFNVSVSYPAFFLSTT